MPKSNSFRSAYDKHDTSVYALNFFDVTLTQQHMSAECDINNIVKQFQKTGLLPSNVRSNPMYADVSNIPDYMSALNSVIQAQDMFDDLPANVRKRFNNNPAELLEFCSNPDNLSEAIDLGIVENRSEVSAPASDVVKPSDSVDSKQHSSVDDNK